MSRETNSLGYEYWWTAAGTNQYLFNMVQNDRPRMGGHVGEIEVDKSNLGIFEAQGGPVVAIGDLVEGRTVTHIRKTADGFVVTVQE